MHRRLHLFITLALVPWTGCTSTPADDAPNGGRGAAATVHPLATEAAIDAMKRGGNAIDAAVAAALTLNVVDGFNSGIGGGCFIVIRLADGRLIAIDGRETAPALAHRDMYLRDGKAVPELSRTGLLAAGVPGALAAYDEAVTAHGRLNLRDLLLPAADLAERGFVLDRNYARRLVSVAETMKQFDASREIFFKENGEPYGVGDTLRQPDLAGTFRQIADHGAQWFYRGPFARRCEAWMLRHGGLIREADLAAYEAKRREPVVSTYRGHTIVGFPPPSSGGVHVAQILNILESFDLRAMDEPTRLHVIAEAMKLAFADRAHWLGDPDFARVPRGLIDEGYARGLAGRIDLERTTEVKGHGTPPGAETEWFGSLERSAPRPGHSDAPDPGARLPHNDKRSGASECPGLGGVAVFVSASPERHTTHLCTADGEGNWVAITATINTTFGCKAVMPGTGIVFNNEMDDFAAQPGVPNFFGLLGAEANAIAPGKRPLSSMSPTIVLREGRPVFSVGAAGGPTIISQAVLAIVNHVDLGMGPRAAIGAARIHHQWSPDVLRVERRMGSATIDALRAKGHEVELVNSMGVSQAMGVGGNGMFQPEHDPRVNGRAMRY